MAILGPNGRGKTSFLKCLLGIFKLKEGSIHLGGQVGYVPQATGSSFPYEVLDTVLMGRARHVGLLSAPKARDYQAAWKALAEVGMDHLAHRPLNTLSGGQQQLVLVARALASECDILVLDEPASALDLRNQEVVLQLVRRLARQGLTVVFTTHNPQHASFAADRVLLMYAPQDFVYGETHQVMTDENLRRLYGVNLTNVQVEYHGRTFKTVVHIYGATEHVAAVYGHGSTTIGHERATNGCIVDVVGQPAGR